MVERKPSFDKYSEVGQSINPESRDNGNHSLEEYILGELGFENISEATYTKHTKSITDKQIPIFAVKDILAIDLVDTTIDNKLRLLGYRFWHNEPDYEHGNYELVKKLLPEGLIRIDDTVEDVLNNNELIEQYEYIDKIENITNQIVIGGPNYVERYKKGLSVVSRLDEFDLDEDFILESGVKINKYISRITRKNYREYDNEELSEVEFLGSAGLYAKEISWLTGISRHKVAHYMSALYYDGRLEPQKEKIKYNKKYKSFVRKVEELRNLDQDTPLSNEEIARKLNTSKHRVRSAVKILIILGRVTPLDMSTSLKKYHENIEDEEKIRQALRQFKKEHPKEYITFSKLKKLSGVKASLYVIGNYYRKIASEEEVSHTRWDTTKIAEQILISRFYSEPDSIVNIAALSRKHNLSRNAFLRALNNLRASGEAPNTRLDEKDRAHRIVMEFIESNPNEPLIVNELAKKFNLKPELLSRVVDEVSNKYNLALKSKDFTRMQRLEFIFILRNFNPEDSVDLNRLSKKLGVHRRTLLKWYVQQSQIEELPEIQSNRYRDIKNEFLEIMRNIRNNHLYVPRRLEDYAIELGVKTSTVRLWYWEFNEVEEMPPLKNAYYRDKKAQALELMKAYLENNEGVINLSEIARKIGVEPSNVQKWYRKLSQSEKLPPTRLSV